MLLKINMVLLYQALAANTIGIGNNTIQGINVEAIKQIHGKGFSLGYRFDNIAYSTDVNNLPDESMKKLEKSRLMDSRLC